MRRLSDTMTSDHALEANQAAPALPAHLPGWLLGLVVLVPLLYAFDLTWQEYLRLGLITAGLAYLWWGRSSETASVYLLAGALIFGLVQFDPAARATEARPASALGSAAFLWLYAVPLLVAVVLQVSNAGPRSLRLTRLDRVVLTAAALAVAAVVWQGWTEGALAWSGPAKVAIATSIWFLVTRWAGPRPGMQRALRTATVAVFAVIVAVGGGRIAAAVYCHAKGEKAQRQGDMGAALYFTREAAERSATLALQGIQETATFRMAGILYGKGQRDAAAQALSLDRGFVHRVEADEWEGPEKGNLYYLGTCWKDLPFYVGEAEIRIFARGKPALDVWPLMRVRLADQALGDVFVSSEELQTYSFQVKIDQRSHRRLEVGFLNDYHQTAPYADRNLTVERAEIQYRRIVW